MQVRVRVEAGTKKERVEPLAEGRLKIFVKAKAKRGAANARTIELLARHLGVAQNRVRLVRGRNSPSKIFEIITTTK